MPLKKSRWGHYKKSISSLGAFASRKIGWKKKTAGKKKNVSMRRPGPGKSRFKRTQPIDRQTNRNPPITFTHGRPRRISPKFAKKVIAAITKEDSEVFESTVQLTSSIGGAAYWCPQLLNDPVDWNILIGNALTASTARIQINNSSMTYQFKNMQNSNAFMHIYECVARNDVPYIAGTFTTPLNYLNQGFTDNSFTNAKTTIKFQPFQSPSFCTRFRVVHQRKIDFGPGGTEMVTLNVGYPITVNQERIYAAGTGAGGQKLLEAVRGHTRFFLFKIWGDVVDDATTPSLVSVDAVKISAVVQKQYNYKYVQDAVSTIYYSGGLGAVAAPKHIDELTGVAELTVAV